MGTAVAFEVGLKVGRAVLVAVGLADGPVVGPFVETSVDDTARFGIDPVLFEAVLDGVAVGLWIWSELAGLVGDGVGLLVGTPVGALLGTVDTGSLVGLSDGSSDEEGTSALRLEVDGALVAGTFRSRLLRMTELTR